MTDLHRILGETPLAAFDDDSPTPETILTRVFGPLTTVTETVHCDDGGAWRDGWYVITPIGERLSAFWLPEFGQPSDSPAWGRVSRGGKAARLDAATAQITDLYQDVIALGSRCVESLTNAHPDGWDTTWYGDATSYRGYTGISNVTAAWMLRATAHRARLLDGDADALWTMLTLEWGLTHTKQAQEFVHRLDTLVENMPRAEQAERELLDSMAQKGHHWLTSRDVERAMVMETILATPRDEWWGGGAFADAFNLSGLKDKPHPNS